MTEQAIGLLAIGRAEHAPQFGACFGLRHVRRQMSEQVQPLTNWQCCHFTMAQSVASSAVNPA